LLDEVVGCCGRGVEFGLQVGVGNDGVAACTARLLASPPACSTSNPIPDLYFIKKNRVFYCVMIMVFFISPFAGRGWAWALWEAAIPLPKGHKGLLELVCKATDESYNTQVL